MRPFGTWLVVLACLLAVGAGLALADAVILHPFLPDVAQPRGGVVVRRVSTTTGPVAIGSGLPGLPGLGFGFRDRPGFGYGWLLATAALLAAAGVVAALLVPARVRVAVERIEAPGGPVVILVAGLAALVLVAATSLLLRYTFLIVGFAPLLWLAAIVALAYGVAGLGVFAGRRLSQLIGGAPPVLTSIAGVVLVVDLALIPYAGWVFGALAAVGALGVAVVTRFGSPDGWNLEALDWPTHTTT